MQAHLLNFYVIIRLKQKIKIRLSGSCMAPFFAFAMAWIRQENLLTFFWRSCSETGHREKCRICGLSAWSSTCIDAWFSWSLDLWDWRRRWSCRFRRGSLRSESWCWHPWRTTSHVSWMPCSGFSYFVIWMEWCLSRDVPEMASICRKLCWAPVWLFVRRRQPFRTAKF